MNSLPPMRFGLTGLGGYAGYLCERLLEEAASPAPAAQLVAVSDPDVARFPLLAEQLRKHGVRVLDSYQQLLSMPIDAVWLPLPIDLHRHYTEMALDAGKAVLCEKPAAGCVDDVDTMIAARDRARLTVAIGFQDAYQPVLAGLKRRAMSGEFGRPLGVQVLGCWPRGQRYFARNDWAGRLRRDGRWVLDGPAGNALSHFLHLPMLLLGPTLQAALTPTDVTAELYRANDIESYDTCSIRLTLAGDVPVHVAFTHACAKPIEPVITLEFEHATVRYCAGLHAQIDSTAGGREILPLSPHPHRHMLDAFRRWCHAGPDGLVGATLESARSHAVAVNAAFEAAPIHDVPEEFVETLPVRDHASLRTIRRVVPALEAATARKCMLHETGLAPWSRPGRSMRTNDYRHFNGPAAPAAATAPAPTLTSRKRAQHAPLRVPMAPRAAGIVPS